MEETIARILCLHIDAPVIDKKNLGLFVDKYCLKGFNSKILKWLSNQ